MMCPDFPPASRTVLFAAILAAASPAAAQAPARTAAVDATFSLQGTVVDGQNRPIEGAEVVLQRTGAADRHSRTGQDGAYRFDDVPAGRARLQVSAAGFTPLTRAVEIPQPASLRFELAIAPVSATVTVIAGDRDLAREVDAAYDRSKSVTAIDPDVVAGVSPVANYAALRLLPGVMNAGAGGRDRFSVPTHIRGGHAWGTVETIDDYPAVDITPVSAEDGGYTASFSTIIPAIAIRSLSVATGWLGVSYGQAAGGVVRNQLKRGSAARPGRSLRVELLSLGEGTVMGDAGGGTSAIDYYVAAQSSLADYGTAYNTFARPIEGLRLASGLAKVGVRTSRSGRWETMYIGGGERHDYFQETRQAGRLVRRDFHTDKQNHFLASRYDWRPSEHVGIGVGVTQNWFHENRIEDAADGVPVGVSRRNRPQRATQLFTTVHWSAPVSDSVSYTGSSGLNLSWDRFEDITTNPIGFSFREQAVYSRHSVAIGQVALNGGVRLANVDNGFDTDARTFYDAGAAWIVPAAGTRVFGSWSTGYKLNKAFYLWWGNGQFIRRDPAVGLRPSTTNTVEVGAEQPVATRTATGTVRLSVFTTREADLFNFGDTGSGIPFYDSARTRGVEAWTEWRAGRFRPFASWTWLRSHRDGSTNPHAANLDLRFAPLPNWVAGFGTQVDVHPRVAAGVYGWYDSGAVSEQRVNDQIIVTRFGSFARLNASLAWRAARRWSVFSRLENLLNRHDLGFDRRVVNPDGTVERIAGTQRDPGLLVSAGLDVRF